MGWIQFQWRALVGTVASCKGGTVLMTSGMTGFRGAGYISSQVRHGTGGGDMRKRVH